MRTRKPVRREDVRDPVGLAGWPRDKGRDGERTPMQWNAGPQAGFSAAARTWLPVSPDYRVVNVAAAWRDLGSLLNWTARLMALRRAEPALREGAMALLDAEPDVLAWVRRAPGSAPVLIAINMGAAPREIAVANGRVAQMLATSDPAAQTLAGGSQLRLAPFAVWIGRLSR